MRRVNEAGYPEDQARRMVMDRSLWETSGHWQNYRGEHVRDGIGEKRDYAIKPMNCPGHVQVFNHGLRSYRDLPLRLCRVRRLPPQRVVRRAARADARARFRAGRRTYFLHGRADSSRSRCAFNTLAMSDLQRFRLRTTSAIKLSLRPAAARRYGRDLGSRRSEGLRDAH